MGATRQDARVKDPSTSARSDKVGLIAVVVATIALSESPTVVGGGPNGVMLIVVLSAVAGFAIQRWSVTAPPRLAAAAGLTTAVLYLGFAVSGDGSLSKRAVASLIITLLVSLTTWAGAALAARR